MISIGKDTTLQSEKLRNVALNMPHRVHVRKSSKPSENRLTPILKAKVRPRIQTRPAQIECHRSTTCATTTSIALLNLNWFTSIVGGFFLVSVQNIGFSLTRDGTSLIFLSPSRAQTFGGRGRVQ